MGTCGVAVKEKFNKYVRRIRCEILVSASSWHRKSCTLYSLTSKSPGVVGARAIQRGRGRGTTKYVNELWGG